jgi:predicted SprT family Zn-dependent metalloprotease
MSLIAIMFFPFSRKPTQTTEHKLLDDAIQHVEVAQVNGVDKSEKSKEEKRYLCTCRLVVQLLLTCLSFAP